MQQGKTSTKVRNLALGLLFLVSCGKDTPCFGEAAVEGIPFYNILCNL